MAFLTQTYAWKYNRLSHLIFVLEKKKKRAYSILFFLSKDTIRVLDNYNCIGKAYEIL